MRLSPRIKAVGAATLLAGQVVQEGSGVVVLGEGSFGQVVEATRKGVSEALLSSPPMQHMRPQRCTPARGSCYTARSCAAGHQAGQGARARSGPR